MSPRYWAWWHRARGHRVHRGWHLLNPMLATYRCDRCGLTWTRG